MMTRVPLLPSLVVLSLAFVGCAHQQIPGTQIEDTSDTRAILQVMEAYRHAVEGRDAAAIARLVAPGFHDDAGTSDPADDLNAQNVQDKLQQRFAKIDNVKLDIDVKSVEVKEGMARVVYSYDLNYSTPGLSEKPQSASDIKEMVLKKIDGKWKIISGI